MFQQSSKQSQFEEQFDYRIRKEGSPVTSPRDPYRLDLLGFVGAVPMLTDKSLWIDEQNCKSLQASCTSVEVDGEQCQAYPDGVEDSVTSKSQQIQVDKPEPQQSVKTTCSPEVSVENSKLIPKSAEVKRNSPQTVKDITSSALQGKKVIIRTNSMSGEKSLIFKHKTGGNVEIPARFSTFLKAPTIKEEVIPIKLAEHVHPSNVAHVVFPQSESMSRHTPTILKRPCRPVVKKEKNFCDVVSNEVENVDIKTEDESIFAEETKISPFDHDYFNVSSRASEGECDASAPPHLPPVPTVVTPKLSPKEDEVIEIDDDEDSFPKRTDVIVIRTDQLKASPVQIIGGKIVSNGERRNQNSSIVAEGSVGKFQGQQLGEETDEVKSQQKRSEEKHGSGKPVNNKTNESSKKLTPATNYEIVNTNLFKKPKDLTENKGRFIVMIAKKEMIEQTQNKDATVFKSVKVAKDKVTPPSFKIPFRPRLKEHKKIQTEISCATKNAETNTDDFLLDDLIEKRMQERALQNKVSKTTNTDEPAVHQHMDERITVTPSPFLFNDPSDLLEFLDGPNSSLSAHIIGENADFGTGPMMGHVQSSFAGKSINNMPTNGKIIENCAGANITDISYTRGKNMCNSWGPPAATTNMTSAWPVNAGSQVGQNGRPRIEPWKLQLFLDLKNCDQFDSSGNMPIHKAVIQNNLTLVRRHCLALRTRQIDINTLNHDSYTALQLALLHDASVAIVQLLLQYGADTSVIDSQGNNVLHICIAHASEAATKTLLSSTVCADINGVNFEGYTPLILCVMYEKHVKADDLLSTGADPNVGDKKSGRTPLFHAVEANDVEMVKLLLNYKAETKLRNFFGTSPHDVMFELDTVDPRIRKLILTKDEVASGRLKVSEVKGRRKRRSSSEDRTYSVRPYGSKSSRRKASRS